jgi:hypothetical protein
MCSLCDCRLLQACVEDRGGAAAKAKWQHRLRQPTRAGGNLADEHVETGAESMLDKHIHRTCSAAWSMREKIGDLT